jgi:hypothetical protein
MGVLENWAMNFPGRVTPRLKHENLKSAVSAPFPDGLLLLRESARSFEKILGAHHPLAVRQAAFDPGSSACYHAAPHSKALSNFVEGLDNLPNAVVSLSKTAHSDKLQVRFEPR